MLINDVVFEWVDEGIKDINIINKGQILLLYLILELLNKVY
jgi:hypothetical protein